MKEEDNDIGFIPTGYRVVVEPLPVEEKTKGGLILPDTVKDKQIAARIKGRVIAIGPLAFQQEGHWGDQDAVRPKIGDFVMYEKYAGYLLSDESGSRVINDTDIFGILTEKGVKIYE